jgi:hypothetical protein
LGTAVTANEREGPVKGKIVVVCVAVCALGVAGTAETKVRKMRDAKALSNAFVPAKFLRYANFVVIPPNGNPAGLSRSNMANFSRAGSHFAILSTGNSKAAGKKDTAGDTGFDNHGPLIRGTRDAVMLRVALKVPKGKNCLSFGFKFLSEEFPEFVDSDFNDAFIAELDKTAWDSERNSPVVNSKRNFALDSRGNPIRVNTVGNAVVKRKYAKGTTFDAATRTLRAQRRISAGKHFLYLSIFDQGDRIYDSAVFLDALRIQKKSSCKSGVVVDN